MFEAYVLTYTTEYVGWGKNGRRRGEENATYIWDIEILLGKRVVYRRGGAVCLVLDLSSVVRERHLAAPFLY